MEGEEEEIKKLGVRLQSLTNILQSTQAIHEQKFIDNNILEKVTKQIGR